MEDDLTLGDGHTMQYTDHVSHKCIPKSYMTYEPTLTQ